MTDSTFNTHSELDEFFGPRKWDLTEEPAARPLGIVVGGSLSKGLEVKLDRETPIETTAVGRYVVIEGQGRRFFSMVTDVQLDATDPRLAKTAPDMSDDFMREIMIGTSTFGLLHVSPMLVLEDGATEPKPVKTVPGHFARVVEATPDDVNKIFGEESEPGYFHVGEPLDMDGIRIYLNLKRFVERSSGVFGKSGTGKTFLTRMLLAGIVKENVAVNLIFDMHNEYGWKSQNEARSEVKGLRQLFPSGKVAVVTLDPESSRRRDSKVDFDVAIGYDQLEPEDVEMLQGLMGLSDVQVGALYSIRRKLGKNWIVRLLDDELPEEMQQMVEAGQIHEGTLGAIQRKLSMFQRFGFLRPHAQDNVVEKLLDHLNQGTHVVLEFGRYGSSLEAYLLVANYLTRRIHHAYVERKEAAQGGGRQRLLGLLERGFQVRGPGGRQARRLPRDFDGPAEVQQRLRSAFLPVGDLEGQRQEHRALELRSQVAEPGLEAGGALAHVAEPPLGRQPERGIRSAQDGSRHAQKTRRAAGRIGFNAEKPQSRKEAVAREHRGLDGREAAALREKRGAYQQAQERVPPRGMVEINHQGSLRRRKGRCRPKKPHGVEMAGHIPARVSGEPSE